MLSPKFPSKEVEFSAALQEWELDLAKYATEFEDEKAISDEDKRALLMVESPTALKQHLAMHASSLTAYDEVRQVVVSCLQAKRVWTPNATYAHHGRAKDPDAMDIGKIGDKESPKGKGKGKDKSGKGKKGDKPKGKGDGHQLGEKGKDNKEKEKCPICWRAGHRVQDCWFNSKGKGKGQGKKGGNTVNQVADDNASVLSAGPSASQAGSTASTTKPGLRRISDEHMRVLRIGGGDIRQGHLLVDTGATVSVCRPGTFKAAVDLEQKQKLYSVDDTLLNTQGVTEPVLELGDQNRQTARTTCQVVEGITDDILSVNRAVDAGAKVVFHKPRVYRVGRWATSRLLQAGEPVPNALHRAQESQTGHHSTSSGRSYQRDS